jgi:hypothetical protein
MSALLLCAVFLLPRACVKNPYEPAFFQTARVKVTWRSRAIARRSGYPSRGHVTGAKEQAQQSAAPQVARINTAREEEHANQR